MISVVANATIILPVPYAVAVFILGGFLDPVILGLVSGFGAAIGELTGYALGLAWRGVLAEEKKRKLEAARKLLDKSAFLTIFIFSATPLPVDVISIPVGMMKYPIWKAFLAFLAGKIVLCLAIAFSGKIFVEMLIAASEAGGIWGTVGTVVAIIVIIALILLIDWEVAFNIVESEGWMGLVRPRNVKKLLGTVKQRWRKPEPKEAEEAGGAGEVPVGGEEASGEVGEGSEGNS